MANGYKLHESIIAKGVELALDMKIPSDGLARAENAMYTRRGAIEKRFGQRRLKTSQERCHLFSYNNQLLSITDDVTHYPSTEAAPMTLGTEIAPQVDDKETPFPAPGRVADVEVKASGLPPETLIDNICDVDVVEVGDIRAMLGTDRDVDPDHPETVILTYRISTGVLLDYTRLLGAASTYWANTREARHAHLIASNSADADVIFCVYLAVQGGSPQELTYRSIDNTGRISSGTRMTSAPYVYITTYSHDPYEPLDVVMLDDDYMAISFVGHVTDVSGTSRKYTVLAKIVSANLVVKDFNEEDEPHGFAYTAISVQKWAKDGSSGLLLYSTYYDSSPPESLKVWAQYFSIAAEVMTFGDWLELKEIIVPGCSHAMVNMTSCPSTNVNQDYATVLLCYATARISLTGQYVEQTGGSIGDYYEPSLLIEKHPLFLSGTTLSLSRVPTIIMRGVRLASKPILSAHDADDVGHYFSVYWEATEGYSDAARLKPISTSQRLLALVRFCDHYIHQDIETETGEEVVLVGKCMIGTADQQFFEGGEGTPWFFGAEGTINNPGNNGHRNFLPTVREEVAGVWSHGSIRALTPRGADHRIAAGVLVQWDIRSGHYQSLESHEHLRIAASCPMTYDGRTFVEEGFLQFPEGVNVDATAVAATTWDENEAGTLVGVEVRYRALYEWIDTKGVIHQSAPSPNAVAWTPTDGIPVCVVVPSLQLTRKTNVKVVIFRSGLGVTANSYERIATVDNEKFSQSIHFIDTGLVDYGQPLYAQGGYLETIQPPPSRVVGTHQGRIFWVHREYEENLVEYSKVEASGLGLEHSDILQFTVPSKGGRITGLTSWMGRLYVFKEKAIYAVMGEGYNNYASDPGNSAYARPELISDGIGCVDPATLVQTTTGIFFSDTRGIFAIAGNGQVIPVGENIRYYTDDEPAICAVHHPKRSWVIFYTATRALVFHLDYNLWTTWKGCGAVSAVGAYGTTYRLDSAGAIHGMDESVRYDYVTGHVDVIIKLESRWLNIAGLMGAAILHRIIFSGHAKSTQWRGVLKLQYDNEAYWQTPQYLNANAGAFAAFDWTDYLEDGGYAGTEHRAMMLKGACGRPRLTSMRWLLTDAQSTVTESAELDDSFSLTSVSYYGRPLEGHKRFGTRAMGSS